MGSRKLTWMKWLTSLLSKSSPPKWVSPAVDLTSKIPSSIERTDTSKVPPPRSKIRTFRSAPTFLSKPENEFNSAQKHKRAAAVFS